MHVGRRPDPAQRLLPDQRAVIGVDAVEVLLAALLAEKHAAIGIGGGGRHRRAELEAPQLLAGAVIEPIYEASGDPHEQLAVGGRRLGLEVSARYRRDLVGDDALRTAVHATEQAVPPPDLTGLGVHAPQEQIRRIDVDLAAGKDRIGEDRVRADPGLPRRLGRAVLDRQAVQRAVHGREVDAPARAHRTRADPLLGPVLPQALAGGQVEAVQVLVRRAHVHAPVRHPRRGEEHERARFRRLDAVLPECLTSALVETMDAAIVGTEQDQIVLHHRGRVGGAARLELPGHAPARRHPPGAAGARRADVDVETEEHAVGGAGVDAVAVEHRLAVGRPDVEVPQLLAAGCVYARNTAGADDVRRHFLDPLRPGGVDQHLLIAGHDGVADAVVQRPRARLAHQASVALADEQQVASGKLYVLGADLVEDDGVPEHHRSRRGAVRPMGGHHRQLALVVGRLLGRCPDQLAAVGIHAVEHGPHARRRCVHAAVFDHGPRVPGQRHRPPPRQRAFHRTAVLGGSRVLRIAAIDRPVARRGRRCRPPLARRH